MLMLRIIDLFLQFPSVVRDRVCNPFVKDEAKEKKICRHKRRRIASHHCLLSR